jgi:outer membrane protein assembly factor BamB
MVNYLICSFYIGFAYKVSPKIISLGALSVLYSAYAYAIGKKYGTLVWSNDIATRTLYHSLMHLSTSSIVYFAIQEANAST